jgi:predicted HicB family RNase H-like nuclease
MKNTLNYKGFIASVSFVDEDNILFGKIEGINDLIMFEGESVTEIKKIFREAVDEYIESCKHFNKPLLKSFKGSFNVRVKPDIHQQAAMLAKMQGISLNQLVQKAIEKEIQAA